MAMMDTYIFMVNDVVLSTWEAFFHAAMLIMLI
jgi:hypothetical protein